MRREENERIKPAPVIDTLTQVYTPTPNGVYTSVLCTCIRRVKDAICIRSSDVSTFAPHWRLWYSLSVVGPFIRIRTVNIKRSGLRLGEREKERETCISAGSRYRAVSFYPTATLIVTKSFCFTFFFLRRVFIIIFDRGVVDLKFWNRRSIYFGFQLGRENYFLTYRS